MSGKKSSIVMCEAILCSLALMIFSFLIHYPFPVKVFSFVALLTAALIIGSNLKSSGDLKIITGEMILSKKALIYTLLGIAISIILSVLYRWHLDKRLFATSVKAFIVIAALTGCTEELVYRGFIQGYVSNINKPFSVLFSSLSHTGYKCCLFMAPAVAGRIELSFLAIWTFGVGLVFGYIRQLSGSILPSVIAHALFDILVYAEFAKAPWWVW